jgi:anti-sigma B factor antagonist
MMAADDDVPIASPRPGLLDDRLSGDSLLMSSPSRIDVREVEGVKVVRFQDRQLFDERTVREIAEQIAAAVPNDGTPIKLILDFGEVALISSSLLSKLILLQRRVDASNGKMRLCEMSGVLQSVFRTSNLDRLFKIDRDLRAALAAFAQG